MFPRLILILFCILPHVHAQDVALPQVLEPGWEIELVLAEPEIVTPTACCFDQHGRLLVVECHTHFPPDDYPGPKSDRIYALEDTDGDGLLDKKTTYYPGGTATMGLATLADGSVIAVTRSQVSRHWDEDGNGIADKREVILKLNTEADYPHNGLGGLTVTPDGQLLIGLGENFGAPYELVARDGSKQVGSGEGGSIFRMTADGERLQRIATGFWNPFGICCDPAGQVWTVGNDPDAMPPCRLLHVVEGGDYGFQFRFGRGGRHPLQAWNGELPGTLPFAAGTGEAASGVASIGDRLWVTSWGDNRIEAYKLSAQGSSWTSGTEVIVQGGPNFRPVGIVQAADGSVYFTDWVDRSYSVHSKGRIWRLRPTRQQPPASAPTVSEPQLFVAAVQGRRELPELLTALDDPDPFVHQCAMAKLAKSDSLNEIDLAQLETERQRTGVLAAWRWRELSQTDSVSPDTRRRLIQQTLQHKDVAPKLIALRWAAERDEKPLLDSMESLLAQPNLDPELFPAAIAAISYLRSGTARSGVRDAAREQAVITVASNPQQPPATRAMAVRMLPTASEQPAATQLLDWLKSTADADFQAELIRFLRLRGTPEDRLALVAVAQNQALPEHSRADAVIGLSLEQQSDVLRDLSRDAVASVALEAKRVLRESIDTTPRLPASDLDGWLELVGTHGDARAGERVFWRRACSNCHAHQGRGADTGPELTSLHGQSRRRVLESILNPSKEVGPMYAPWQILTTDGRMLLGLKSVTSGVGPLLKFQDADGHDFEIHSDEIETQSLSDRSIMPDGLEKTMTVAELRDLLAFLTSGTEH